MRTGLKFLFFSLSFNLLAGWGSESICGSAEIPAASQSAWIHLRNSVASLGEQHHAANDAIVPSKTFVTVTGRFSYGPFLKAVADETVELWLDHCEPQATLMGRVQTDSDGFARFQIFPYLEPGVYRLTYRVQADGSLLHAWLTVTKPQAYVTIFDIDGTLTINDREGFKEACGSAFGCTYEPTLRPGAITLTRHWDMKGSHLVYLSSRHHRLTDMTRSFLKRQGFASGTVMLSNNLGEWMPTEGGTGKFKANELKKLVKSGLLIAAVYGNSKTDIYAFRQAGVSDEFTHIVGEEGTLGEDFEEHLKWLRGTDSNRRPGD